MRRAEQIVAHLSGGKSDPDKEVAMYSSRQRPLFGSDEHLTPTTIQIDSVEVHSIPKLPSSLVYPNRFVRTRTGPVDSSLRYNQMISEGEVIMMDIARHEGAHQKARSFVRAGPRDHIIWGPKEVRAAVVTCGGLCPGLNDVVTELFNTLYYNYGVNEIYGIRNGFRGFWALEYRPWKLLTPESMKGVHELGGSVLGCSRGGFDMQKIIDSCLLHGVNQIYIIGGDGTHRAANEIANEALKKGLKLAVACIPKTIDNDVGVIDRSFGFNTAVVHAKKAIRSAVVEASCSPNGVGIVQLMGRHAGYLACAATLASREVDVCLIPEVEVPLEGFLSHLASIVVRNGSAVVVVAEGAGQSWLPPSNEKDESGNVLNPEIGRFLSHQVKKYFATQKLGVSIKYHDPSYMIRSVCAEAEDSIYCQSIAQNAVHGAMGGFTGFTSGLVNNRTVLLPIGLVTSTSPSFLNPHGRTWERVLSLTHQPRWVTSTGTKKAE